MQLNRYRWVTKCLPVAAISALFIFLFLPAPAYAMHIAEGILPFYPAAAWYALSAVFVGIGIYMIKRKTQEDRSIMPLLGITGAAVFLISCLPIPVPIAGTCSHPCGTPLAAILVGPFISTVLAALALLIQALFLAHGGFTTWGANIFSMGVMGSFVGFGSFVLFRRLHAPLFIAAFAAGLFGDWATYATTAFELASGLGTESSLWNMFATILIAFAPTQIPLGILEGLFTGGVVSLIYKQRPELLDFRLATAGIVKEMVKGGNA